VQSNSNGGIVVANPEHLKILEQGIEAWNRWRAEWIHLNPDLSKLNLPLKGLRHAYMYNTDLNSSILCGADLFGADLTMCNLRSADLRGASLGGAKLVSASLQMACLQRAKLYGTSFARADLTGADFAEAHLQGANLSGATLNRANLAHAAVESTVFVDVDLSAVRGLDTVLHLAPSSIGIDTVYRSKGNIPELFLRGCGVPEDFITYMRSLAANPIEFYSCFISYSSKDQDFTERLHADLQQKAVRCWFAPEDLKIGDKFRTRIDESIRMYDKLMVILSENSIQSTWVEEEVEAALEKERKQNKLALFPIRLDDAVMDTDQSWAASLRRTRHIGDFRNWKAHDAYMKAFDRLLRDLKAEKKPPEAK
jgi:uncharacterized protein YjbI with pentapeptide repeats